MGGKVQEPTASSESLLLHLGLGCLPVTGPAKNGSYIMDVSKEQPFRGRVGRFGEVSETGPS